MRAQPLDLERNRVDNDRRCEPMVNTNPDMATEKVGTVIDRRYRITGLLGRGGMGSVYKAEHVRIRRPVAVKLLHPQYGQIEEIAKRFEREAFATGRIDHPNIVTISDFGELDDGTLFLVMELLSGVSLGDVLDEERRLAPDRALRIIKHVLRGLGQAHAADIVHRDIKPENVILVEHAGDPEFAKLLDFGIAKLLGEAEEEEGGEKLTQAGVAFGTPTYISPEQATGSNIDHRADLYSTSVMLFEMITGKPPFQSEEKLKLLAMHATRPAPAPSAAAPELPWTPELERLISRGLEKDPADRWADAAEFMSAIDAYLEAQKRAAEPPPPPPRPPTNVAQTTPSPELLTSGVGPATIHTGMTAAVPDARKKKWIMIGLIGGGVMLLVIMLANAARSSSDGPTYSGAITRLERGATCEERKSAVRDLRKIGDKRAISALETAAGKKENACLAKDARSLIKKLDKK